MSPPLLFCLSPESDLPLRLAAAGGWHLGNMEIRHFPDGESYVRYDTPVTGRSILLLSCLDRPDGKLPALLFAAATARDLGAASVGLICPYLPYMRQDSRFRPGEALTAGLFARILSTDLDWLVTVDPHLHRFASLSDVYSIPAIALHAAPLISAWAAREIERPLFIGPDAESEQWVSAVAREVGAPYRTLRKTRRGDRDVEVSVPDIAGLEDHTPVLVDDIASTARTMIKTVQHVRSAGLRSPVCIVVHGIFAGESYRELRAAGASRIVSTNTIPHESNGIDVTDLLAQGCRHIVAGVDPDQGAERGNGKM